MNSSRTLPRSAKPFDKLLTMLLVALIIPTTIAVVVYQHHGDTRPWPEVRAQVLQTRIVAVAAQEHPFRAGTILYRAEAHVAYDVDGQHVDRWLPVSKTKNDSDYLEEWLSTKKDKFCIVHWNPRNPSDIEAVLH